MSDETSLKAKEEETVESRIDECNAMFSTYTTRCSDICRQIVFALFIVVWSLAYREGTFYFSVPLWLAMFALMVYLGLDVGQYLYTSIRQWRRYEELEHDLKKLEALKPECSPESDKLGIERDDNLCNRIAAGGFRFFLCKMSTLVLAVLLLCLAVAMKWTRQAAVPPALAEPVTVTHTADF
ncbi:hypothetical protein [uncultured Rikenella sp.]|uniref:hypothetical protein n=1 Tax=uncultured Rikenella sp. TaxID=368003 RepID=UPI00262353F6|nr:hypothetical protein [uncultured Rikenella sp.]